MTFLKKLLAFWKWAIVGIAWSYVYVVITLTFFKFFWGFNYLSRHSWRIISKFWDEGGRIRTASDYFFILALILLIPLWIMGWKKLYRTNYAQLLLFPILWYQKRQAGKYMKKMSRIKIRNVGISVSADVKQDFDTKLKQQQMAIEKESKASQDIRSHIKNKLNNPS